MGIEGILGPTEMRQAVEEIEVLLHEMLGDDLCRAVRAINRNRAKYPSASPIGQQYAFALYGVYMHWLQRLDAPALDNELPPPEDDDE